MKTLFIDSIEGLNCYSIMCVIKRILNKTYPEVNSLLFYSTNWPKEILKTDNDEILSKLKLEIEKSNGKVSIIKENKDPKNVNL